MADRVARLAELVSAERETATLEEMFQRMTSQPPEGLPAICAAWDVPYGRVLNWLMADEKRYAQYERALEVAAHALVSETVTLADGAPRVVVDAEGKPALGEDGKPLVVETPVARSRLQIDTRFHVAQFNAREKYGERAEREKTLPHVQINIGVRTVQAPAGQVIEADNGDV